jgi:hypothetical protein
VTKVPRIRVAERAALIADRAAELIAAAFEESIVDESLPAGQRARIVRRFTEALVRLEGETIDGRDAQPLPV